MSSDAILFAKVDAAKQGAHPVVPGVAGKVIRVISDRLFSSGTVTVKWQSGEADLTGPMPLCSGCPMQADSDFGLFESRKGKPLKLWLADNIQVGGHITYVLMDAGEAKPAAEAKRTEATAQTP